MNVNRRRRLLILLVALAFGFIATFFLVIPMIT